jgi:hypothetical protein
MIIDSFFPVWLIALILIPLTILLTWKEWRRPHNFRTLRTLSTLIMMISLAGLVLKPKYASKKLSSIILLTPEYSEKKLDSVLQAEPKSIVMRAENTKSYENSPLLPYHDLIKRGEEIRIVLGQGLPTHALDLIENKDFHFIPASLPEGIISLIFPEVTHVKRKNVLAGTFNSKKNNVSIKLTGPGGKEDSVRLPSKGLSNFKLSFVPKQSGNLLFPLSIMADTVNVRQENLPIHAEEERRLNILFVKHHPTFEIQYLKNFLGRKNHSVVLRYQLSKNNFRYEYLNRDPLQINRLTNETLDNFDLLITDGEALETLSHAEKSSLKKSIQSGLGILNLSDDFKNKNPSNFLPFQILSVKTDTAVFRLEKKSFNLPAIPQRVGPHPSISPLQKTKNGILSGYTFEGAGKIAFQFLQETYRLALSGDSAAYSEIWAPLIEQVARPMAQTTGIRITNAFPWYENEPIDIEIISTKENFSLEDDSIQLPLLEDVAIDNVWHARTWAGKPGWHTLKTSDGISLPYYISRQDDWKSLAIANQLEANSIARNISPKNSAEEITTWKEIPLVLFYLMFLIAAGFIWLAPKLS